MRLHACSPMIIASSKWKGSGGESTLRHGGSEKRAVGGHEEGRRSPQRTPSGDAGEPTWCLELIWIAEADLEWSALKRCDRVSLAPMTAIPTVFAPWELLRIAMEGIERRETAGTLLHRSLPLSTSLHLRGLGHPLWHTQGTTRNSATRITSPPPALAKNARTDR